MIIDNTTRRGPTGVVKSCHLLLRLNACEYAASIGAAANVWHPSKISAVNVDILSSVKGWSYQAQEQSVIYSFSIKCVATMKSFIVVDH